MHNPDLPTSYSYLMLSSDHEVLVAIYQLLFAAITAAFALVFLYMIFKFLAWFLPNYWHRGKE